MKFTILGNHYDYYIEAFIMFLMRLKRKIGIPKLIQMI